MVAASLPKMTYTPCVYGGRYYPYTDQIW